MTERMPAQEWFEMADLRRRRFASSVWIPLRVSETISETDVRFGGLGYVAEVLAVGSVAFSPENREQAETLGWGDLGLLRSGGPYAFRDGGYKPCEIYQRNDHEDFGIDLVFEQRVGGGHGSIWHLNQDLVLALNLIQEGDSWIRPDESYVDVVRQRRNSDGKVIALEVRSEFLRDYLAARGLALRLAYYRQRQAVLTDASHVKWPKGGIHEEIPHDKFKAQVFEVDADGGPFGGDVAVFHAWRTDVYPDDDVPEFSMEDDTNIDGSSRSFARTGPKYYRIEGELWRSEWIDPSPRSERVRGDEPVEPIYYVVDAAGTRSPHTELDNEDIGCYLWFEPRVISALIARRNGGIEWYTLDTGSVWCSPDYKTHFGINRLGLVNVYAYDVAKLPFWQQRIWSGHNIAPDAGVSSELLESQMKARPAHTEAPEKQLQSVMNELNDLFMEKVGHAIFRSHDSAENILQAVHRFRAVDHDGLLSLAKDVARLTADRIDVGTLRKIVEPPIGQNWGSLRFLQEVIARIIGADEARTILSPLVGIYKLRLGDAHLPSSEIRDAFELVGIDRAAPMIDQGCQLIGGAVQALTNVYKVMQLDS